MEPSGPSAQRVSMSVTSPTMTAVATLQSSARLTDSCMASAAGDKASAPVNAHSSATGL